MQFKILNTIFVLIFLLTNAFYGKNHYQIKGDVTDDKTYEPLVGVNILVLQTKAGTITDINGNFTLNLEAGNYTFRFTYLGYLTITKQIIVPSDEIESIKIKMKETSIDIGEVIVTGNPFMVDTKNFSQSTLSLSRLDLMIRGSSSIADALNFQPGIATRSNGIATSRPVIRGFSNNKVLILEDGLRMGDLSSSSDDHAVSDDGSDAEKIEVIEGPSSLLYGSNAIGGVINIITDAIPSSIQQGLSGEIKLNAATVNNEYLGNAHFNYGIGNFSMHTKLFKHKSEDYKISGGQKTLNSNIDSYGYLMGASYFPKWGTFGISFNDFNNKYGIPSPPTTQDAVFIEMNKKQIRLNTDVSNINSFITSMNLKAGYLDYTHKEISINDGTVGTQFGLHTASADLSFLHTPFLKNSNGIIGIFGMLQNYKVKGSEALTPNANYESIAAYFLEKFNYGPFLISLGARYEINSVEFPSSILTDSLFESGSKTFNPISISAGIIYNLSENTSFFINLANAFRAPTIEELTSFGIHEALASFDIGNRNLSKETSSGLDLGIRIQNESLYLQATGYLNKISNLIYRQPLNIFYSEELDSINGNKIGFNSLGDGFRVYKYDQSNANVFGFETKLKYEIFNGFISTIVSDYVRAKNVSNQENLPQIPPFRFSTEFRYATAKYWTGITLNLVAAQNDVASNEEPTAGYGIVGFYLGLKIPAGNNVHIINLKIDNLFDKAYKDHLSAIKDFTYMPGRNISLYYKFIL